MMSVNRLPEFLEKISSDLDRTVEFWLKYSHDNEYGGFFNCLSQDGQIYDELKHVWLQARQVWMYSRLYTEVGRFRRQDILTAAEKGADFLQKHAKNPETYKCHLILTRDGRPVKIQRSLFSECFYLMAMSEFGRASGKQSYKNEALEMMKRIQHWIQSHGEGLGAPKLEGVAPASSLAIAMMTLCLIDQMQTMDPSLKYDELSDWALKDALKHVQRDGKIILENTTPNGKELGGSNGRLMLPGHSIEAGWFLLQYAVKTNNEDLKSTAINNFIVNPFNYGWDDTYGGLFYFLDADGWSPTQLEWDMKLWWAHNESLIAFLMAYKETKDVSHLDKFTQIFDYSYSHFVDQKHGEWYGYLNRRGEVSLSFKGGPWKDHWAHFTLRTTLGVQNVCAHVVNKAGVFPIGCFHVPRYQVMCEKMLKELLQK